MTKNEQHRDALKTATRVVVKAGSKVLVQKTGSPDTLRLNKLVDQMAAFKQKGGELAFVSSGAVGAGLDALGFKTRPKAMADLQMAAAVGQTRLMSTYSQLFAKHDLNIGQVLLTHDGLKHRERHLNARNTLLNLIAHGIVPIINENDTISTEEIKFGDNDVLAALVAILIDADALVLLSTTDGFREPAGKGKTRRVSFIEEVDQSVLEHVADKKDALSTGGMASKLASAQLAAQNGVPVVIANGRKEGALTRILDGEDEGTLLFPMANSISKRKRWIAFFNRAEGSLQIDLGAEQALNRGKSLLPIGIQHIEGHFKTGAMINITNTRHEVIARGLTEYPAAELQKQIGKKAEEGSNVAVHRDNMVLLKEK